MSSYKTTKLAERAIRFEVFIKQPAGDRLEGRYTANQLDLAWPDLVLSHGSSALRVERINR